MTINDSSVSNDENDEDQNDPAVKAKTYKGTNMTP